MKKLNLSYTDFNCEELQRLSNLKKIESLDLQYMAIAEGSFKYFNQFYNLKELDISFNKFSKNNFEKFFIMSSLKIIIANFTNITNDYLENIRQLKSLQKLSLNNTHINGDVLSFLSQNSDLEFLDISGNNVTGSIERLKGISIKNLNISRTKVKVDNIKLFPNIRYLNSSHTFIDDLDCYDLQFLTQLSELIISNTEVSDEMVSYLQYLGNLKTLDASSTYISDESVKYLPKNLEKIHILNTLISDNGVHQLCLKLPGITHLSIGPNISNKSIKSISKLKNMKKINIHGSLIDNEAIVYLKSLYSLEQIAFFNTSINQVGLDQLVGYLPQCKITS